MPVGFQCGLRTKRKQVNKQRKKINKRRKAKPPVSSPSPLGHLHFRSREGTTNAFGVPIGSCSSCYSNTDVKLVVGKVRKLIISSGSDTCHDEATDNTNVNRCPMHPGKTVDFLCVTCDVLICTKCKIAEHQEHKARSLSSVATEARRNLQASLTHVTQYERNVKVALRETERHRQVVQDTRDEVEGHIRARHAQLQTLIDGYRDSALLELDAMTGEVDSEARDIADRLRMELMEVQGIQQRLHEVIERGSNATLAKVNQETKDEWDENHVTKKCLDVIPGNLYTIIHKELQTRGDFISVNKIFEGFIKQRFGCLLKRKRPLLVQGMMLKTAFRCSDDTDTNVFYVCPYGDKKVVVSFGPSHTTWTNTWQTKSFFEDGRLYRTFNFEKCSLRRCSKERFLFLPVHTPKTLLFPSVKRLYAKADYQPHFMSISSEDTWFLVSFSRLLRIFSWPELICHIAPDIHPVAFDVSKRSLFAVVSEETDGEIRRQLLLCASYQDYLHTVCVYKPPADVDNFFPSDVCFFTFDSHEVLLVADSVNHTISMLSVKETPAEDQDHLCVTLEFDRVLVDKEHLQHAPTALNRDDQGRLWVGCKGGYLMTMQLKR